MAQLTAEALAKTRKTVQSYEGYAREYDSLVAEKRPPHIEDALRRLVRCLPPGGTVLEIGSGPGRDADFVESLGASVRRTDAARAFLDLMAERGQRAELLNVVTDALGGPYDGVLAMGVLIHVEREQIDAVLHKIHAALKRGGAFLVAMRKGTGETGGDCLTVCWPADHFAARLAAASLTIDWQAESVGRDGNDWVSFLARRAS
ncbi:2-polyprenyl-3-methyl-5-hydroxy-6-metoxy-1,4-benzoquinol methylase [Pelomonas saccharophila]|uniref:2-polyprenyl-3-methyl-5-hydroxy-6-metoxy-1, 4-benzoquinol methylase n=1 Tax=Roseateles saccharophilus TaxID=304 RepID=A0ABU1YUW8_ROSSA|nr:class I SAM-dependent methyltransferase [Roseateles saccharophilus]MDR7272648.1 2-polyprenyl-3-methyl-5-hydroxy-6-metoxy-1,4-benzoquinol methylase [Roseateles saccharophilus]